MEPSLSKMTETALLQAVIAQNADALSELYDRYSMALYGVILRIVKSETLAEELLQETFVKVWNNASGYDASKGRLFTWLLNIARNGAIDATRSKDYKKQAEVREFDFSVHVQNDDLKSDTHIEQIGLREIVEKLDAEHQLVIDTLYFRGFTQREAAEELGLPLGTVKTRARNAIQQLRKIFT